MCSIFTSKNMGKLCRNKRADRLTMVFLVLKVAQIFVFLVILYHNHLTMKKLEGNVFGALFEIRIVQQILPYLQTFYYFFDFKNNFRWFLSEFMRNKNWNHYEKITKWNAFESAFRREIMKMMRLEKIWQYFSSNWRSFWWSKFNIIRYDKNKFFKFWKKLRFIQYLRNSFYIRYGTVPYSTERTI